MTIMTNQDTLEKMIRSKSLPLKRPGLLFGFLLSIAFSLSTVRPGLASDLIHSGYHPEIAAALTNPALQARIQFWKDIYSKHSSNTGIIHDSKYIDKIYAVVDLKTQTGSPSQVIRREKAKWRKALTELHIRQKQGLAPLGPEQEKAYALYADINDPNRFLDATHRKRLRWQTGQKDHFEQGLIRSGRWLPAMEEAFKQAGIPVELTRLPFVESSFNLRARSKVGASGVWQFMRSTGKNYLKINAWVDERNDPLLATRAAAQLLKQNYESLESWPLAVTAYNHGRQGMMRAVRSIGSTLIEEVLGQYRSRSFGFASSNFFTCLLAAIEVERDAEKHFGPIQRDRPRLSIEFPLPASVNFSNLISRVELDFESALDLNPALDPDVTRGNLKIPAGYLFRVPLSEGSDTTETLKIMQEKWSQGFERRPPSALQRPSPKKLEASP